MPRTPRSRCLRLGTCDLGLGTWDLGLAQSYTTRFAPASESHWTGTLSDQRILVDWVWATRPSRARKENPGSIVRRLTSTCANLILFNEETDATLRRMEMVEENFPLGLRCIFFPLLFFSFLFIFLFFDTKIKGSRQVETGVETPQGLHSPLCTSGFGSVQQPRVAWVVLRPLSVPKSHSEP